MRLRTKAILLGLAIPIGWGVMKSQEPGPFDPYLHGGGCEKTIQIHDHGWDPTHSVPIRLPTSHPSTMPCAMADWLVNHTQGDVNGH